MANNYFGYFLQGLSGGINQGMQIKEMRRKREAEDQLAKVKAQFEDQAMSVSKKLDEFKADGIISDDEVSMWNTMFLGLGAELQDRFKSTNDSISKGYTDKIEQDNEWYKGFLETTKNITNTEDLKATFEYFNGFVKTDEAKKKFAAYYSLAEKQLAAQQAIKPETFTTAGGVQEKYPGAGVNYTKEGYVPDIPAPTQPKMADEKSAIDVLKVFIGASPETFEKQRRILEQRTGLDLSNYTQDILKESGNEVFNLYNTPEEVMAKVKAPTGLTVVPSRDSKTGKYFASFQKEAKSTTDKVTDPEGILFGINGIMKDYINSGSQLGDQQKAEIRNNYDIIKPSLDVEAKKQVEDYLQQIGIDVNAPAETPIPEPTPETAQPNLLQKGVNAVKG